MFHPGFNMHAIGTKSGILFIYNAQTKGGDTSKSVQLNGGKLEAIVIYQEN